jgi:integrase/recombinase XerD
MTKSYLDQEEVKNLEMAATNLRDKLLVRLLSRLGCRVSEALSLTVEDIDLAIGTIRIQHLKSRMRLGCPSCGTSLGKRHSYCPGCGKKVAGVVEKEMQHQRMRTLPVDTETLSMLKEYVDRGGPVSRDGKRLIFGINRHRAWQIVKESAKKAGLPKLTNPETGKLHNVSPHRLRDAFAVHAIKQNDTGDGLRLLQEHLGHQNFNTTAKYRKVSGEELREWYNRLWKEINHDPAA